MFGAGGAVVSNLLTNSRLRAHRKCQRLEFLAYQEGWRPVASGDALLDGTLWHTGLEAWWLTHDLDAALAAVAGRGRDPFTQVKVEEMLRGYHNRWINDAFDVIGVEVEFRVPLLNPATMQASRTWTLGGKIDVLLRDGIVEHKSSSEDISPGADYWLKLALDTQLSLYVIGAESHGVQVKTITYDVALKPGLKPLKATPVESRKYKQNGELYAAQREFDETPEEYRLRTRAAIEAEPDRYYQRREVPRMESQIADYMADCWAQAKNLREENLSGRHVRNPDACFAMGKCWAWDICSVGVNPEDHPERYQRIAEVHPELAATEAA